MAHDISTIGIVDIGHLESSPLLYHTSSPHLHPLLCIVSNVMFSMLTYSLTIVCFFYGTCENRWEEKVAGEGCSVLYSYVKPVLSRCSCIIFEIKR